MPNAAYSFQQIAQTETPAAIKLRVRNAASSGALPLDFTVLSNQSWLVVSPVQGSLAPNETIELWVSANTTGLISGTYLGELTISDAKAINSPFIIEFTLQVDACEETFEVTLTACAATIQGATPTCSSAIDGISLPCSSAIHIQVVCGTAIQTSPVPCSSAIQAELLVCSSSMAAELKPCATAIQATEVL